jgi:hypothetical protein
MLGNMTPVLHIAPEGDAVFDIARVRFFYSAGIPVGAFLDLAIPRDYIFRRVWLKTGSSGGTDPSGKLEFFKGSRLMGTIPHEPTPVASSGTHKFQFWPGQSESSTPQLSLGGLSEIINNGAGGAGSNGPTCYYFPVAVTADLARYTCTFAGGVPSYVSLTVHSQNNPIYGGIPDSGSNIPS